MTELIALSVHSLMNNAQAKILMTSCDDSKKENVRMIIFAFALDTLTNCIPQTSSKYEKYILEINELYKLKIKEFWLELMNIITDLLNDAKSTTYLFDLTKIIMDTYSLSDPSHLINIDYSVVVTKYKKLIDIINSEFTKDYADIKKLIEFTITFE